MMPTLWQRIIASKLTVLLAGMAAGAISAPLLGRATRPLIRDLIKAGIVSQQEILRIVAGLREELEDITAEAKAELGEPAVHANHDHDHDHDFSHNHRRAQA
ncbi:Hypothetical protein A7982_04418 [Minicystis rosea]|nr:Hypothetical protein A7982_04418 [Minicystis rosea]